MEASPRQADVLSEIVRYRDERGYSPSLSEIAEALGVTKATVRQHVDALVHKGLLSKTDGVARSLVPIEHRVA